MSERLIDVQREMKTCVHFNGIQHDTCEAGIRYDSIHGSGPGWAAHMVCLQDPKATARCGSLTLLTRPEAEKLVDERKERMERFLICVGEAHNHAKAQGLKRGNGGAGEIPCPARCGGTLRYTVASVNGHMHGRCSTNGCVSWME